MKLYFIQDENSKRIDFFKDSDKAREIFEDLIKYEEGIEIDEFISLNELDTDTLEHFELDNTAYRMDIHGL